MLVVLLKNCLCVQGRTESEGNATNGNLIIEKNKTVTSSVSLSFQYS